MNKPRNSLGNRNQAKNYSTNPKSNIPITIVKTYDSIISPKTSILRNGQENISKNLNITNYNNEISKLLSFAKDNIANFKAKRNATLNLNIENKTSINEQGNSINHNILHKKNTVSISSHDLLNFKKRMSKEQICTKQKITDKMIDSAKILNDLKSTRNSFPDNKPQISIDKIKSLKNKLSSLVSTKNSSRSNNLILQKTSSLDRKSFGPLELAGRERLFTTRNEQYGSIKEEPEKEKIIKINNPLFVKRFSMKVAQKPVKVQIQEIPCSQSSKIALFEKLSNLKSRLVKILKKVPKEISKSTIILKK